MPRVGRRRVEVRLGDKGLAGQNSNDSRSLPHQQTWAMTTAVLHLTVVRKATGPSSTSTTAEPHISDFSLVEPLAARIMEDDSRCTP